MHPDGHLTFESVRILLPDGHVIIEDATVNVMPGERVLIVGDTGRGKSTLFRAVAGLWRWGSGTILTPAPEAMTFLPQRPYLPLGTLRNATTYPGPPDLFSDLDVRQALERCDPGNLVIKLDRVERWDKELSLGEQERLAFARLLLHKPGWVFLDEATAALDEDSQRRVMILFDAELKNTTVLSIGHRPDLAAYHTRTPKLVHGLTVTASSSSRPLPRLRRGLAATARRLVAHHPILMRVRFPRWSINSYLRSVHLAHSTERHGPIFGATFVCSFIAILISNCWTAS